MSNDFVVSAVQFSPDLYRVSENRTRVEKFVREEAALGASLIVFPELAISGYGLDSTALADSAEPFAGRTQALLSELAQTLGVVITCGFCEICDGKLYNSAMLVAPNRSAVLYRKLHLFDKEKGVFEPGNCGLVIAETVIGKIGICVCYDLRFVEVARGLSLAGADLLAIPTAWVGGFDQKLQDDLGYINQARGAMVQANLNQIPMVCASQSGRNDEFRFLGSSLIADAFGDCQAGPLGSDDQGTIRARMSLSKIYSARVRSPNVLPREDRRSDVYGLIVSGQVY